jgi:hypothetical protein
MELLVGQAKACKDIYANVYIYIENQPKWQPFLKTQL